MKLDVYFPVWSNKNKVLATSESVFFYIYMNLRVNK